ncbi:MULTISPECIES: sensor histidine kinase [Eubacteriales]|jgi:two-component system sensor histidine kinase AgrC|uniref:sensor histidine kinase n=1 Tax=Eubacteriales TaxID=186802 RepID=UPI000E4324AF|nr:GHKL domain-containing protein [Eubacterium sp. OM08-24]RGM21658.1 ATP-binding protein [Eubacterium sp. OM08-24]
MTIFCYATVHIFEAIISYIFFSNKFTSKLNNNAMFLCFFSSSLVQFIINLVSDNNFTNLIGFIACNILLCIFCFNTNIFQSIYATILLTSIMFITEMCVLFLAMIIFKIDFSNIESNSMTFVLVSGSSKLLFFFVAYFVSKLSIKENKENLKLNKTNMLFFLPMASILIMGGMSYIALKYELDEYAYILFVVGTILLMYSNIVVFLVHESVLQTQAENTSLKLQKQKSEIDTEYYSILQNQYENSNILIHDIKRHLLSIKELSNEKDFEGINKYIDNLYENYQIKYLRIYSDNKLINAIINRYMNTCKDKTIDFYCDIRDIDFSFMSDNDITSLLDNLLENAIEATQNANNKKIELTVKPINTNYIVINAWNYCSSAPNLKDGKLQTTKSNKFIHGYGIKSIERIAKQYDGNVSHSFNPDEMKFTLSVVLKIKE